MAKSRFGRAGVAAAIAGAVFSAVAAPSAAFADDGVQVAVTSIAFGADGAALPIATVGTPYSAMIEISSQEGGRLAAVEFENLPDGITHTGEAMSEKLTGIPKIAGTYDVQLIAYWVAWDGSGEFTTQDDFTLQVAEAPRRTVVEHYTLLWFLESESGINKHCPDSHPYLINQKLAARVVPHGVSVEEDPAGGMLVTASAHERNGYQSGVRDMIITNFDFTNAGNRWARVTLNCTNDASEAQPW